MVVVLCREDTHHTQGLVAEQIAAQGGSSTATPVRRKESNSQARVAEGSCSMRRREALMCITC